MILSPKEIEENKEMNRIYKKCQDCDLYIFRDHRWCCIRHDSDEPFTRKSDCPQWIERRF